MTNFDLTQPERSKILQRLLEKIESFRDGVGDHPVSPSLDHLKIKSIAQHDFSLPMSGERAVAKVISGLEEFTVHTAHPKYFGLYNPRSNFPGILADLITAAYNPQMAAWSHAPFAGRG